MAKKSFRCRVVTPTASLVDDDVVQAVVPCWDGSMGFLPGRSAFLGRLGAGELRLDFADNTKGEGGSRSFLVEGGFARMDENELLLLAEKATPAESLVKADAEAELKAALSATVSAGAGDAAAQMERITRDRERARAKVRLAGRASGI